MTESLNYWDLSERERSELSHADVQRFLDFELMQKGVLKVTAPVADCVVEPNVKPCEWFAATAQSSSWDPVRVVFASRELAESFLELAPCVRRSDYLDGASIEYASPFDSEIKSITLLTVDAFQEHRSELQAAAAAKAANAKRKEEWEKSVKLQSDALKGLWDDWYACCEKAREFGKVRSTWTQYVTMAGDERLAAKFLLKVFTERQIREANEWFAIAIPLPEGPLTEAMQTTEAPEVAI